MKRLSIVLLVFAMLAFPSVVLADIAPPINPPGSNLQPGSDVTQVRMLSETVLIDVKNDITPDSLGSAAVTADFTMRNLGSADESMAVRFPVSADNGRGQYPEITNLVITINGRHVSYRRVSYPDIRYQNQDVPWAEFDVTFPVGQDVAIEVTYNLSGSGYQPYTAYYYLLETGAGWKDTIGSADVILRLPYPASPQNIVLDQIGWAETTPGGTIQGNEMRWHFENFEPGPYDVVQNMEFALVAPYAWQPVLKERANVSRTSNDGEAWGRLAKAYKELFFLDKAYRTDAGGEELYKSSVEAYEKCLALLPNDAQWHAGFADLLASRSYWDFSATGGTADLYRGLQEIRTALQLAPNDAKVQEIAQVISGMFPDAMSRSGTGYDFLWLTQTPTPYIPPTIALAYDPAAIRGTYESDMLTLTNGKQARLILTLRSDYSVEMKIEYKNDRPFVSSGSWKDYGNDTLSLEVADPDGMALIMSFTIKDDVLRVHPSRFYGADIEMKKLVTAAPLPTSASTPEPTSTAPAPKSSSPICRTAALAPLAIVLWTARRRKHSD